MAFVPFNNTIKIEAVYIQDGQYVENVLHYIVDETPNVDTALSLAESWFNWWDTDLKVLQPNTVSLVKIKWTIMENDNDPGGEWTTQLPEVGTYNSPALPNNVTVAVRLVTPFRGRSYRGRIYHVGLTEGVVTGNTVSQTYLDSLIAAYGDMVSLTTDVGPAILGVASRFHNGVERSLGVITPVVSIFVDPIVDSQRRRLPNRGK